MIYLHKTIPVFLMPVGIVLSLVLAGVLLHRRALVDMGGDCFTVAR